MRTKYRSDVMASIHNAAKGLHAAGLMDKQTMRTFDVACLTPVRPAGGQVRWANEIKKSSRRT